MSAHSTTAPAQSGNFFPVTVLITLVVLVAMLFALLQSANVTFPDSYGHAVARTPFFRGLIYIPQLRLFRGAAGDESKVPPAEMIKRWDPYIKEASARFSVPEKWIRTIINIESGGRTMLWGRPITSGAGAMGVMQLMHQTYNEMSTRNGLGSDPYNVHDNILAGTAYLRELYNRYGYPRLFEAYNAGPGTLENHIAHHTRLPAETVNYVRMAVTSTASPAAAKKAVAEAISVPVKAKSGHAVKLAAAHQHHVAGRPVRVAMHVSHAARPAHGHHHA